MPADDVRCKFSSCNNDDREATFSQNLVYLQIFKLSSAFLLERQITDRSPARMTFCWVDLGSMTTESLLSKNCIVLKMLQDSSFFDTINSRIISHPSIACRNRMFVHIILAVGLFGALAHSQIALASAGLFACLGRKVDHPIHPIIIWVIARKKFT